MRVLEQKPVLNQTMGKKKHKLRKHSKDNANFPTDSSDESHQGAAGKLPVYDGFKVTISKVRPPLKKFVSCSAGGRHCGQSGGRNIFFFLLLFFW